MTRVVKIEKTGGPEVLKFEAIELGKPGPEEVLIEHKAIGLNFIDTYHRSGVYPVELPSHLGVEGAAVVTDLGTDVEGFNLGDRVAYAGLPIGAYSEQRNYPADRLIKIPESIPSDLAAASMLKGLTAW